MKHDVQLLLLAASLRARAVALQIEAKHPADGSAPDPIKSKRPLAVFIAEALAELEDIATFITQKQP